MKKNILLAVCCVAMLSVSTISYSAEGPYVSGNLGLAIPSDSDITDSTLPGITFDVESDMGLALGAAAGYDFGNNIRVEGEVAYQKNDLDKVSLPLGIDVGLTGNISSLAFLLNGYYDFANDSAFTPFISAGLGVARVDANDLNVAGSNFPSTSADDTVFAYQVGAGVGYAVNKKVSIDVKYRYFATSDPDFDTTNAEYSSNNFYVGVRDNF